MHKTTAILLVLSLFSLLITGSSDGMAQQLNRHNFKLSETDRLIKVQRLLRANSWLKQFSGVVLVAKNGEPLYKYTTGYANFDYSIHNSLTGQYNLCEITQSFTALAILQLVEQNKIDLQAPISNYISKLPKAYQQITPHQLLIHTAGVIDYYDLPEYIDNFLRIDYIDDLLEVILYQPLQFQPGEKFQRSSSNYVLLAKIVEQVSGKKFEAYLREKITHPIKMLRTDLSNWNEAISNKAVGYSFDKDSHPNASPEFWGAYPFGADAIYSDVEELLLFTEALKGNKLISKKYKELLYRPNLYEDSTSTIKTALGYGWKTKTLNTNQKVIFQGGYIDNLSTQVRLYEDGFTVIVFSNYFVNVATDIADRIEQALYNEAYTVPRHPLAYFFYELIEADGIGKVVSKFDDILSETHRELDKVWTLNALAKDFYKEGKKSIAEKLYVLNMEKFPSEPIVYESLGEFYYYEKDYSKAKSNYQKKLSILPRDPRAIEMLKVIVESANAETDKKADKKTDNLALKKTTTTSPKSKLTAAQSESVDSDRFLPEIHSSDNIVIDSGEEAISLELLPFESKPSPSPTPPKTVSKPKPSSKDPSPTEPPSTPAKKAPSKSASKASSKIYTVVSKMPEFPGGQASAFEYLTDNLSYPPSAYQSDLEGTVHVSFIVNESGYLDNIQVKKSLTKGLISCDNEALRLVRQMPKWTPGYEDGKTVKVLYTLPILFRKTDANRPAQLDEVEEGLK